MVGQKFSAITGVQIELGRDGPEGPQGWTEAQVSNADIRLLWCVINFGECHLETHPPPEACLNILFSLVSLNRSFLRHLFLEHVLDRGGI